MKIPDLNLREKIIAASLIVVIIFLGLFPQPVFDIAKPALDKMMKLKTEIPLAKLNRITENDPNRMNTVETQGIASH